MNKTATRTSRAAGPDRLLQYELTPIAELTSAVRNAREHGPSQIDALAESVDAFGIINPVIIDGENRIVAGHGRVEAAKRAGRTAIATLRVEHLTPAELRLYAIADNRIAERSTWDESALALELQDLRIEAPDLDLSLSGFEHPKIEVKIASLDQSSWSDLDKVPESPTAEEPVTRKGDIWDFSQADHSLACADSTSAETVSSLLREDIIDLVATDYPYNLAGDEYSGKGKHQHGSFAMAAGEMSREEFTDFLTNALTAVSSHLRSGALIYGFMDWKHIADLLAAGDRLAFELKNIIVWDKGKGGMGTLYRSAHELIAVFKHGKGPQMAGLLAQTRAGYRPGPASPRHRVEAAIPSARGLAELHQEGT